MSASAAAFADGVERLQLDVADPSAARLLLDEAASSRFFGGAADPAALASIVDRLPVHRESIIRIADNLIEQLPAANSQLSIAEDQAIGWEPQRQQWLLRLAQAYALTGERRYADACHAALEA